MKNYKEIAEIMKALLIEILENDEAEEGFNGSNIDKELKQRILSTIGNLE